MAEAYGSRGIAKTYALIFGIAYVVVALLEVIAGRDGWTVGGAVTSTNQVILAFQPVHNLIHWATGVVVLGSFFAGESAARGVTRVVGVIFLIVTLVGLIAPKFTMDLLGYGELSPVPISYTLVHAITAIGALYAGFSGARTTATA